MAISTYYLGSFPYTAESCLAFYTEMKHVSQNLRFKLSVSFIISYPIESF